MTLPDPPILVITDRRQARRPLEEIAAAVFAAGGRWLSLREKDLDPASRAALLARLVALGRGCGAIVGVHEDAAAARTTGAGALHLPAGVLPPAARRALGAKALIGGSAHDQDEITALASAGADYATLSPIFPSASKPGYGPALGLDRLARAAGTSALNIIALGGVDDGNAASCIAAGAAGVAVMGSVMTAADPGRVMAGLIKTLKAALAARRGAAS
ncbi:MAG TPA: thiamine phosphate synthase [Stellaceae bacterium]|nr:thiamine phosphate synthase [Stellaceae bacterium]